MRSGCEAVACFTLCTSVPLACVRACAVGAAGGRLSRAHGRLVGAHRARAGTAVGCPGFEGALIMASLGLLSGAHSLQMAHALPSHLHTQAARLSRHGPRPRPDSHRLCLIYMCGCAGSVCCRGDIRYLGLRALDKAPIVARPPSAPASDSARLVHVLVARQFANCVRRMTSCTRRLSPRNPSGCY